MQPPRPRLRSLQSSGTEYSHHATSRRMGSEPRLGDQGKPMELVLTDVLVGYLTLEGNIPFNKQGDIAICVKKALGTIALVPANHITMSVTNENARGHSTNVVKFHFIL